MEGVAIEAEEFSEFAVRDKGSENENKMSEREDEDDDNDDNDDDDDEDEEEEEEEEEVEREDLRMSATFEEGREWGTDDMCSLSTTSSS